MMNIRKHAYETDWTGPGVRGNNGMKYMTNSIDASLAVTMDIQKKGEQKADTECTCIQVRGRYPVVNVHRLLCFDNRSHQQNWYMEQNKLHMYNSLPTLGLIGAKCQANSKFGPGKIRN